MTSGRGEAGKGGCAGRMAGAAGAERGARVRAAVPGWRPAALVPRGARARGAENCGVLGPVGWRPVGLWGARALWGVQAWGDEGPVRCDGLVGCPGLGVRAWGVSRPGGEGAVGCPGLWGEGAVGLWGAWALWGAQAWGWGAGRGLWGCPCL